MEKLGIKRDGFNWAAKYLKGMSSLGKADCWGFLSFWEKPGMEVGWRKKAGMEKKGKVKACSMWCSPKSDAGGQRLRG